MKNKSKLWVIKRKKQKEVYALKAVEVKGKEAEKHKRKMNIQYRSKTRIIKITKTYYIPLLSLLSYHMRSTDSTIIGFRDEELRYEGKSKKRMKEELVKCFI